MSDVIEEAREFIGADNECPMGHKLPHLRGSQQCTPVFCVDPPKALEKIRDGIRTPFRPLAGSSRDERSKVAREKMEFSLERHDSRQDFLHTPVNLEGADAEKYVQKRLVDLAPTAIGELEFQLKTGDDRQRAEMAREILDRGGFGKRDGGAVAVGPIMIITTDGKIQLPWKRAPIVIDADAIDAQIKP